MTFNLDQLPVAFGTSLIGDDGLPDRGPLNESMRSLLGLIWRAGRFRFFHLKTTPGLLYEYSCSQDTLHERASESEGKRDRRRMGRFPCKSKLQVKPNLGSRTLWLSLFHHYHTPYEDIQLSEGDSGLPGEERSELGPCRTRPGHQRRANRWI